MNKKEFTNEDIVLIKKKYLEGNESLSKIGSYFSVSKNVIKRILVEEDIPLRKKTTKYKQNTDIFENIDTPEKAYWLGFIAADGCVYKNKENSGTLIISIHRKDRAHLEHFRDFIGTDRGITDFINNTGFGNNTPMSKISIYSTKLVDDLINKGVHPNKSLVLKPPLIKEEFWKSYLLGYFDGDGSISHTQGGKNFTFSILGTKETLEWAKEILGLPETKIEAQRNIYYIRCGGLEKPYKALKNIYHENIYSLDRKKSLFKEMEKVVLNRNI